VTQATVDAVVTAYETAHPDVTVDLFRAPTGELNARLAAERREGGIQADVLWLTDPLSMQAYDADDLLLSWTPTEVSVVPAEYRSERFWGTRVLNVVIVHQADLDSPPASWSDLAQADYRGGVALPDPGFAGSAFGVLAYFALSDDFGFDYYRALADNGASQVKSPGEVVTGVAEGRFVAGMTLDFSARNAVEKGSPVALVWPASGAIAMHSPIAVFGSSVNPTTARSFVDFVLGREAQEAIAATGWEPIRDDVDWSHSGPVVTVDWTAAFGRQRELLDGYRAIFGG
jgi:iron(III) transport system substrate-binding protein